MANPKPVGGLSFLERCYGVAEMRAENIDYDDIMLAFGVSSRKLCQVMACRGRKMGAGGGVKSKRKPESQVSWNTPAGMEVDALILEMEESDVRMTLDEMARVASNIFGKTVTRNAISGRQSKLRGDMQKIGMAQQPAKRDHA